MMPPGVARTCLCTGEMMISEMVGMVEEEEVEMADGITPREGVLGICQEDKPVGKMADEGKKFLK